MPELRTLIEEVRGELMNGDPRHALDVCEHILDRYPKHLEAHCLSAEALRELGESKSARERFLRVLSADPENVIAYWGLSIIFEEEDQLEAAIWGIDTALSVTPGHRELAQEFFRLTGEAPSLSRAGLARIRFRGGQYDLAVREAEAALAEEPDRLDTRVLLAEALWRAGRSDDARRVCEAVLRDAPDCLKANLILGQCLLQVQSRNGHHQEGLRLLRRTLALDPEARVAGELFAGAPLPNTVQAILADLPSLSQDPELAIVDGAPSRLDERPGEAPYHQVDDFGLELAEPTTANGKTEEVAVGDDFATSLPDAPDLSSEIGVLDEPVADVPAALVESEPESADPLPEPEPEVVPWLSKEIENVALGGTSGASPTSSTVGAKGIQSAGAGSPGADDSTVDPTRDPEWAELLTMEASLDAESEARLNAALAEMGFDPTSGSSAESAGAPAPSPSLASEEDWREVFTGNSGLFAALEPSIAKTPAEPAVEHPSEAAPTMGEVNSAGAPVTLSEETTSANDDPPVDAVPLPRPNRSTEPAEMPTQRPRPEPLLRPASEHAPGVGDFRARLQAAYAYQQDGNLDAAVVEYVQLIRSAPDLLEEIVENLKLIVYTAPEHAAAHRALGDAYMRSGRFQEAIDQYNWVLGQRRAGSTTGGADA